MWFSTSEATGSSGVLRNIFIWLWLRVAASLNCRRIPSQPEAHGQSRSGLQAYVAVVAQVGFLRVLPVVRRRLGGRGAAGPGPREPARPGPGRPLPVSQGRCGLSGGWPRRAGGPGPGSCCNLPRSLIDSGPGEMKGGPYKPGPALLNLNVLKSHSHG